MKKISSKTKFDIQTGLAVLLVVFLLIVSYITLTVNSVISMAKETMTAKSDHCATQLDNWTERIISELDIYRRNIEDNFSDNDERLLSYLTTTYQVHDAYPMGIYIGDNTGVYMDASGWVPGEDWVLEERPWYMAGKDSEEFTFCEPYLDAQLGIICTSVSARLDYEGAVRVMATDVYVDYADQLIREIMATGEIDGALFVTGESHTILADSGSLTGGSRLPENQDSFYLQLDNFLSNGLAGNRQIMASDGACYVNITHMNTTDWYLITYIRQSTLLSPLKKTMAIMVILGLCAMLVLVFLTKKIASTYGEMTQKAKTDKLTHLLNREGFMEVVTEELERRPGQGIFLLCDLDNFKSINDTLGHPTGDQALVNFANHLENFFNRNGDYVARIGGDEFAVFCGRELSKEDADIMVEKFIYLIKRAYALDYPGLQISASAGGVFVGEGQGVQELYQLADAILYEVKQNRKGEYKLLI